MKSYLKFLSRNKAYTLIDVFGLAVSFMFLIIIGAYTWQENHLDSQHSKLSRMYLLGADMNGRKYVGSHWHMINRLMSQFPEIESATALKRSSETLLGPDGSPAGTNMLFADSAFFSIFDFELEEGDPRTALDAPNAVVVTREYARKLWGDADPIGKSLRWTDKDADPMVVTAVMKPLTNSILAPSTGKPIDAVASFGQVYYVNQSLVDKNMGNAMGSDILLLAKEGNDLSANRQKYHDFAKEFFWIFQLPERNITLTVIPYSDFYFSEFTDTNGTLEHGSRKLVNMLFLFGLVILLFALMNYVNLTVALSGYRAKEMATRRLLGESRAGIMLKLIWESLALCILSFAIGALLAWLALPYAERLLETDVHIAPCVTPVTVTITIAVILLMGILAGIVPAWLISTVKPIDVVRGTLRRRTKMVFSKVFIVVQNVITIVMVASAITMYLQVNHLVNAPLGYDTDDVMYLDYYSDDDTDSSARAFMDRVSAITGVEAVTACTGTPLQGGNNNTSVYEVNGEQRTLSFQVLAGDENFMKVFGLGLDRDNHVADTRKVYLNHQAISELGLTDDVASITYYGETETIAGILTDFKIRGILAEQHPLKVTIEPDIVEKFGFWGFGIKVIGDKDEVARQVKDIFYDINHFEYPDPYIYLKDRIEHDYQQERNLQKIVALFAAIALLISMLGLVAMSTYFVQQRQREIAVKKVFGCESNEALRNLISNFLAYIAIAFVFACPLIYYLMHQWLATFSYHIPLYWWIYAAAGAVCAAVSVAAVLVQSYRAANTNPIDTLYQN